MFRYVIVGAGFAGSVIAERIAKTLNEKVLVIDKRHHIGGNCYDEKEENGIILHKYGPHLFHTPYYEVVRYLENFTKFETYQHRVLGYIDGKKVPIPFNFTSLETLFPKELSEIIKKKLLEKYELDQRIPILELIDSEDEHIRKFANFVYEKVFKNYTAKQWSKKPEEIDKTVTARVPVVIGYDDRYFSDKYQFVPVNGYTEIFTNLLKTPNIKLMLNTSFKEIGSVGDEGIRIFGKKFKGVLIYTGAIDELFNYKFGYLNYRTLKLDFEVVDKEYFQEVSVVNYPNDYDFTRITEFKHIHKPKVSVNKTVILKEYPKEYDPKQDIQYYPFFDDPSREAYNKYLDIAKKYKNLLLVGRLAEYKYYDMDDIVKRALDVFENEIARTKSRK
ncbi:MAG: UDP-galactopyranose mutase [Spirochaetia bacterium]|nr:UDP-galactopyranose mutase [Spirochaetota bacterium]MCX8097136.1 UDP-galactopyranose mutase [Spirochaetota bacterium]MDW8113134.1 UDP-galactopyranose mutase [Spirochaetia bacterium]